MSTDDVVVTVNNASLSGWTEARVTRRLEGCPNDFEVSLTERYPGEANAFVIQAGQPCSVSIGGDIVITGYVDRYIRGYDALGHTVSIQGRGKTQDLVDCSAEWAGGQIPQTNAADIATKLAAPYGIGVVVLGENPGPEIPKAILIYGETPWDIIERMCRFAGLLAYENPNGDLVLASGADVPAASGFVEGINVQSARVFTAMDQRYSQINCYIYSMQVLGDVKSSGNAPTPTPDPNLLSSHFDLNVPRHRLLDIVAEAAVGGLDVCTLRGLWEVARRLGRGQQVQVTADSWRDSGGYLWAPNTLAPVNLPNLKISSQTLLIGEVTYRRGLATGTTCDVLLMPRSAFQPEPLLLLPTFPDVVPVVPKAGG